MTWRLAGHGADALPEAVETIASAVGAGQPIAEGLRAAASAAPSALADELRAIVARTDRGMALTVSLDRWADESTVAGAPLVAAAVGLAGDAGGDVDAALAGVASTLRERRALAREIRALSSQARLSAAMIAIAPLGFALVAVTADRDVAGFLLGTTAGLACVGAGVALDIVGWRWMRRITRSVQ